MELLEHGGWILVVVFFLSFFTWILIAHKWLHLRAEAGNGFEWIESVIAGLRQGYAQEAKAACENHSELAGRMMLMAFACVESGRGFSRKHRREIIERETTSLKRFLNLIGAMGAALPLLGLLGTVLGMTSTFAALTVHAPYETNAMMAGGVSEALITTQAGLVTALPIVLMYGLLSSRVRRCMDECAFAMKRVESVLGLETEHV